MQMTATFFDFVPVLPEILVLLTACAVLIAEALKARPNTGYYLALSGLLGATVLTLALAGDDVVIAMNGLFIQDPMADVLKLATYLASMMAMAYGRVYIQVRGMQKGEFYGLLLFAVLGMMVMISAAHFLTLYLGLELLSLALYAMVAMQRESARASEAAMKYFVLGALASGLLLYGMSLLYGLSGSLSLLQISETLHGTTGNSMQLAFALVFIVAGLGFKLGVAPFHMWVPDIYQGAPTAVTLFIASAPKIAAFAFVMRLLIDGLSFAVDDWQPMLALMAVVSLAVGNLAAIMQTNLKRMLAYSTIAHMGFLLLGMMTASPAGLAAGMYYAIAYAVMTLGAFGLILHMSREGFEAEALDDWRGLSRTHPWLAALMGMLLLSMAGLPPFLGFYAKLFVLQALVGAGFVTVAVVAVLLSLIGAYYYLRVIKLMYFDAPAAEPMVPGGDAALLLSINGMAVLMLGLLPQPLLALCVRAIQGSI